MKELSYAELAQRYEVELCTGGCGVKGHTYGFTGSGRLHWKERGVTRAGLRRFLMLVHDLRVWPERLEAKFPPVDRSVRAAVWHHSRNVFAYQTAFHDLGIRLSRRLSAGDRARVRHLLLGKSGDVSVSLRNWAREG